MSLSICWCFGFIYDLPLHYYLLACLKLLFDLCFSSSLLQTKTYVWQPVKQPPKWCEVDPLDEWGIPEFTRADLYTPLFQRRAKRDKNPLDIFDFKFGNRYLAIENVTCNAVHSKVLLGVLERHIGYVRLICAKLKSQENKTYLMEVHLMLRALLPSVREFCYNYCYEDTFNYVCASLLKFDSGSVFFMCVECYCHCADILRLLSCIQAIHSSLDAAALQVLQNKVSRWSGVTYSLCAFHCYVD